MWRTEWRSESLRSTEIYPNWRLTKVLDVVRSVYRKPASHRNRYTHTHTHTHTPREADVKRERVLFHVMAPFVPLEFAYN